MNGRCVDSNQSYPFSAFNSSLTLHYFSVDGVLFQGTGPFQIFQQHIFHLLSVKRKQAIVHLNSCQFLWITNFLKLGYQGFKFFLISLFNFLSKVYPWTFFFIISPLWFFIFFLLWFVIFFVLWLIILFFILWLIIFIFFHYLCIITNIPLIVLHCELYGRTKRLTKHFLF